MVTFAKPECDNVLQPEPLRFAVRAVTHYHTRAWQTGIYGKELLTLTKKIVTRT